MTRTAARQSSPPFRRPRRFRAASSWSRTASPATVRFRCKRTRSCISRTRSRAIGEWRRRCASTRPPRAYFQRLAAISPPDDAAHYRDILSTDPKLRAAADDWLREHEPRSLVDAAHVDVAEHLHRRLPINVIPSEAKATLDVRMLPDEDPGAVPRAGQAASSTIRRWRSASRRRTPVRPTPRRGSTPKRSRRSKPPHQRIYNVADAADDEHGRDRHGAAAREGHAVLRHRSGRRPARMVRRASACTAIRNACWRASCIASSGSTTKSYGISPAPVIVQSTWYSYLPEPCSPSRCPRRASRRHSAAAFARWRCRHYRPAPAGALRDSRLHRRPRRADERRQQQQPERRHEARRRKRRQGLRDRRRSRVHLPRVAEGCTIDIRSASHRSSSMARCTRSGPRLDRGTDGTRPQELPGKNRRMT